MMHYYDKHGYYRGWGKEYIHLFGGAIIRGGDYSSRGYYSSKYGMFLNPCFYLFIIHSQVVERLVSNIIKLYHLTIGLLPHPW